MRTATRTVSPRSGIAAATTHDVIIVGAGSAGCALAARLSEDVGRRVLLLEAGPDYAAIEDFPREVAMASSMAAAFPGHPYNWSFVAELVPGRRFPFARGKIIGGSSTVNGTVWTRGTRADFDGWAAGGSELWSYDQVLPYFKRSETDLDFDDAFHGQDGPIPVKRDPGNELLPASEAFIAACQDEGFRLEPDQNAPDAQGVGAIPKNIAGGIRINTAMAYLATARGRRNLTVLGDTHVHRVLFDGTRAVGVEAEHAGATVRFEAQEIMLCAGGLKTPQLLMLSGVGPADHLRTHEVAIVHDSPGVGRNVKDHPSLFLGYRLAEAAGRRAGPPPPFQCSLNHTAPGSAIEGDMQLVLGVASMAEVMQGAGEGTARSRLPSYVRRPGPTMRALRRLPARLLITQAKRRDDLQLFCSLDAELSNGEISLRSADPGDAPLIRLNYLSHAEDGRRLAANVRLGARLLGAPAFRALGAEVLDPTATVLDDDRSLDAWMRANLGSSFHTTSSARMGPATDRDAVVDQRCRVHGVEGLRVVDISIMPTITRRSPAATAVMIAERAADLFRADDPAPAREGAGR